MRLTDLDPRFIRYETRPDGEYKVFASTLAEAQGVLFQCPKCATTTGHYVDVTFADRGVLPHQGCHNDKGVPTRWGVSGTGFGDLTTTPSILVIGGCRWHGFITNGEAA